MDFARELQESEDFNPILVVTDWLTKVQHYIPAKTIWMAEDVDDAYINDMWKLYDLQKHTTSDRGRQFVLKFLQELNRKLNINLHLSTACHLQTDRVNK